MIPQLEGDVHVHGAESTDEVVFEDFDSLFGGIGPMVVGFDELHLASSSVQKGFDGRGSLVVREGEGWLVTMLGKAFVDVFKSSHDISGGCGFDGQGCGWDHMQWQQRKAVVHQGPGLVGPRCSLLEGTCLFIGKGSVAENVGCRVC